MLKISGIIMVIASCSMAGFEFAARAEKKKDNLISLKIGIEAMEREVSFSKNPTEKLFRKAAEYVSSPVAEMFCDMGDSICENPESTEEIWQLIVGKYAEKLHFSKKDIQNIKNIFSGIGKTDSISQKKILLSAVEKIQSMIDTYQPICEKNAKIYRNMGVLFGIFIAVLFI